MTVVALAIVLLPLGVGLGGLVLDACGRFPNRMQVAGAWATVLIWWAAAVYVAHEAIR